MFELEGLKQKSLAVKLRIPAVYGGEYVKIDHVIPKSKGGTDSWENLTLACSACNTAKGDKLLSNTKFKLARKPRPPLPKVVETVQKSTDPEWSAYAFSS